MTLIPTTRVELASENWAIRSASGNALLRVYDGETQVLDISKMANLYKQRDVFRFIRKMPWLK